MSAASGTSWAKNVKVARAFNDFDDDIIGLDLSRDGTVIVAYSNSQIAVYDITGTLVVFLRSSCDSPWLVIA